MSTEDSAALQTAATTEETDATTDQPTIVGPITEFDRYGEPTGEDYFACSECGLEAMFRSDLENHECGEVA